MTLQMYDEGLITEEELMDAYGGTMSIEEIRALLNF